MTPAQDRSDTGAAKVQREAREWHTLINSGVAGDADRRGFEAWLQSDKAHKQAYFELEQMWRDLDFAAVAAGVDVAPALRARSRWRAWRALPSGLVRPAIGAGLAAAFAALCVLVFTGVPHVPAGTGEVTTAAAPDYATGLGELRDVTLADGSVVTLGPRSEMDVTFTADSRNVILLAGEAFFDVAHDPVRPFFVSADDTLVRVVGTRFDVKHGPGDIHVSVLEGIVDVMKPDALARDTLRQTGIVETKRLTAGQKIVAGPALPVVQEIEQAMPGAWRTGRLAYEDASLTEIIADINRYSGRPIRLVGARAGDIRLTTAFQSSEIETWLQVLASTQGLVLEDQGADEIILRTAG